MYVTSDCNKKLQFWETRKFSFAIQDIPWGEETTAKSHYRHVYSLTSEADDHVGKTLIITHSWSYFNLFCEVWPSKCHNSVRNHQNGPLAILNELLPGHIHPSNLKKKICQDFTEVIDWKSRADGQTNRHKNDKRYNILLVYYLMQQTTFRGEVNCQIIYLAIKWVLLI